MSRIEGSGDNRVKAGKRNRVFIEHLLKTRHWAVSGALQRLSHLILLTALGEDGVDGIMSFLEMKETGMQRA